MSREYKRLKSKDINGINKTGYHHDGRGLYLRVVKSGSKSWVFRYMFKRQARMMGLGPTYAVSLSDARRRAREAKILLLNNIDPLAKKRGGQVRSY